MGEWWLRLERSTRGTGISSTRTAPSRGWACSDVLAQDPDSKGVFLATAHPAKFREVVEPAIGKPVALPAALDEAMARPRTRTSLPADYPALEALLRGF